MDVLQAVSNITCETVKMNKDMGPNEILSFVDVLSAKINRIAKVDISHKIELPEAPDIKTLRIQMVE